MQPESDLAAPAEHSNNAVRLHRDVQLSTRKKLAFSLAVMAALIGAVEVSFRILGLGKQVPVARYISDWHSSPDGTAPDVTAITPSRSRPECTASSVSATASPSGTR